MGCEDLGGGGGWGLVGSGEDHFGVVGEFLDRGDEHSGRGCPADFKSEQDFIVGFEGREVHVFIGGEGHDHGVHAYGIVIAILND